MQSLAKLRTGALSAVLASATLVLAPAPAPADVLSIAAGGMFSDKTTGGGVVSLGVLGIPLTPISIEASGAFPFSNGGYAATIDGRANLAGTTLGAGIGVGTLGNTAQSSLMYEGILGHTIFPHTAIEARGYFGSNRPATIFAGLRLSI